MPVYGAEATLERCLRSIQAQTFANWELLAVDDGSPDRSGDILDREAAKDGRIKVVHQSNGGVASARKAGLDRISGDYAIHIDPDDWVEPTMLEELVAEAKRTGAEMVLCDYFVDVNGKSQCVQQRPSEFTARALGRDLFQRLHGSCCNKLISSACYKAGHFYAGLNLSEDLLYICEVLQTNPKIAYIPRAFYHYAISAGGGSMSSTYTASRFRQLSTVYRRIDNLYAADKEMTSIVASEKAVYLGNVGACSRDLSSAEFRATLGKGARQRVWCSSASLPRRLMIILALSGFKTVIARILGR
jgi:glycosyltransferase family 2